MLTKHTTLNPSKSETKAESTNTVARGLIAKEKAARDAKTKILRAARVAAEARDTSTKANQISHNLPGHSD